MDAVADYERFLSSAGRHLTLLLDCRSGPHDPSQAVIRQIATDLSGLSCSRRGGNAWAEAADQLRCAHDVLASHVGPRGEARTPDAHLLTKPLVIEAALLRVLALTAVPIGRSDDLLAAREPSNQRPIRHAWRGLWTLSAKPLNVSAASWPASSGPPTTRLCEPSTPSLLHAQRSAPTHGPPR